jgi:biopolymer transport protein TolR
MGISTGGARGGPKSDINVTPLVDVVLVLLIIFLVATPILLRYVTVEVPRKIDEEQEDITVAARQIVVLVKYDGTFIVKEGNTEEKFSDVQTMHKDMVARLEAKRTEKIVFMDFEDDVPYEQVVTSMDLVQGTERQFSTNRGVDWNKHVHHADSSAACVKVALKVREEEQKAAEGQ